MTISNLNTNKLIPEKVTPNADFSNAATGTYSESGINYKYVSFTASGSLSVTNPGLADVLIVASGGGGSGKGDGIGAPGGGGGVIYESLFLSTGSYLVAIGAAVGYNGTPYSGSSGNPSQFAGLYAVGGGAGAGEDMYGGNGGSGGGGGGGNNRKPGGTGISDQGYGGGTAPSLFSHGGAGGAGGAGVSGTSGPGRFISITGSSIEYGKGGIGGVTGNLPGMGGGNYAGAGTGASYSSAAGIVIVRVRTN